MEEITEETIIEMVNNGRNTPSNIKDNKRDLSVSPESTETDEEHLRKNKKSKT